MRRASSWAWPQASSPRPHTQPILGYCTNVHAGTTLDEIKRNLEEHTLEVKRQVSPDAPMGVGLWLPIEALLDFCSPDRDGELLVDEMLAFREWLESRGLFAYTLNGFPLRNFHQPVVKHDVYVPDWSHPARRDYTVAVAHVLDHLLPDGAEGSISTLPIGWSDSVASGWADNLCETIEELDNLYENSGRLIHLDLEPEPGCEIADTPALIMFLTVLNATSGIPSEVLERHLRICLDVCHMAVMFEKPTMLLEWTRASRWSIGKVQISSALRAPFRGRKAAEKKVMRAYLEQFAEDRYLHQTAIGTQDGHKIKESYDDLPEA
ncbi:MAG: metabolite traffic protein EboE, partial [bacterium]